MNCLEGNRGGSVPLAPVDGQHLPQAGVGRAGPCILPRPRHQILSEQLHSRSRKSEAGRWVPGWLHHILGPDQMEESGESRPSMPCNNSSVSCGALGKQGRRSWSGPKPPQRARGPERSFIEHLLWQLPRHDPTELHSDLGKALCPFYWWETEARRNYMANLRAHRMRGAQPEFVCHWRGYRPSRSLSVRSFKHHSLMGKLRPRNGEWHSLASQASPVLSLPSANPFFLLLPFPAFLLECHQRRWARQERLWGPHWGLGGRGGADRPGAVMLHMQPAWPHWTSGPSEPGSAGRGRGRMWVWGTSALKWGWDAAGRCPLNWFWLLVVLKQRWK